MRLELEGCQHELDDCRQRLGLLGQADALLSGENRLLEMVARGCSLTEILTALCRLIEELSRGSLCGILLVDPTGTRVEHGADPSLPCSYNESIHGRPVNLYSGPCAMAACLRQQVIAADVASDTRWDACEWRTLAMAHGLRACWSTPIFSSEGNPVGTFTIYWREPRSPTANDQHIIAQTTHLAAVAIERQRTEAALRDSEERFRRLADAIPEVMWFTALEPEKVLYVSPSFERIWGHPVAELYRKPRLWTETIHPGDRDRVANAFAKWITGDTISYHDIEYRIIQPGGAVRWIHERGVLSLDLQGKPNLASGISTDITERKQAEEDLRRDEAFLAEAQKLSHTGCFSWRPSTGEITWSDETYRIYDYSTEVRPAMQLAHQRIHPDDLALFEQTARSAQQEGKDFEFRHRLIMADGAVKHLRVVARAMKDDSGALNEYIGVVMDTTAQVLVQESLERALEETQSLQEQFRLAIDTIPGLVWSAFPDGHIDFLNQRWREYTGLTLEEASGWGWRVAIHDEDLCGLESYWRSVLASGKPGETEARLRRFDGVYRWFLFRAVPLYDATGNLVKWYGQTTDIDDRKRAEVQVQRSEAYLAEAQQLSLTGSFGWSVATGELFWSEETFCMLGYERTTSPTMELVFKRIHPADLEYVQEALDRAARAGTDLDFEHRLLMPDGAVKHLHVVARASRTERSEIEFVGAVMDVTERKESQEAIRAAKARFEGIL